MQLVANILNLEYFTLKIHIFSVFLLKFKKSVFANPSF